MEEQLKEHTKKLEQCINKFDQILSQVAELQSRLDNSPGKEAFIEIEKRLNAIENLENRTKALEDGQLSEFYRIDSVESRIAVIPSSENINKMVSAVDEIPQLIERHIKVTLPQTIQNITETNALESQNQASVLAESANKIIEMESTLAELSVKIAKIEELVAHKSEISFEQSHSAKSYDPREQTETIIDSIEEIRTRQNNNELAIGVISEQLNKFLTWMNHENIRPDLDRLTNEFILLQGKFESLERSILQLSKNTIQNDEFEIRLGSFSREINQLQLLASRSQTRNEANDKIVRFERDIEKLKSDLIWGIQEMRQRIDAMLIGIRTDLLEEDKKRYEKLVKIEMENQKQVRIAHSLYTEITNIKKQLPPEAMSSSKITNSSKT